VAADKDNNKENIAVALSYNKNNDQAPKIIAKGKGSIADNIIEIAKKNNIDIHKDKNLARILAILDIDAVIPVEAYVAVAEIFSYIYEKDKNL
jgi:flagellar biosynthesis protein